MSIAHDIHLQSVRNLTAYQIDLGKSRGFTRKLILGSTEGRGTTANGGLGIDTTLGDCLSDPKENWYRTTM